MNINISVPYRSTDKPTGIATQHGFVLIASLIFLLVLSIFSVGMFRGIGLQEKIAGNIREKERAFHSAESALQFGEWWLTQGTADTGSVCNTVLNANAGQTKVCSNALLDPTTVPWKNGGATVGFTYIPTTTPAMAISTSGGLNTYYSAPSLYINYIGPDSTGENILYQVTASGFGGNVNAVAVVQSTYAINSGIKDLGGL